MTVNVQTVLRLS